MNVNKCMCCLKEVDNDLKCSQCRTARYCSRECQKEHWNVHKLVCNSSNSSREIFGVPGAEKLALKAQNYIQQNNFYKAENLYMKLIKKLESAGVVIGNDSFTLPILSNLGYVCSRQGKFAESESFYKRSLDKQKWAKGENHPDALSALMNLSQCYCDQGKYVLAEEMFKQCYDTQKRLLGATLIRFEQWRIKHLIFKNKVSIRDHKYSTRYA